MRSFGQTPEPAASTLEDSYRRYAGWLRSKLTRSGADTSVDDLVQDTFVRFALYSRLTLVRHPRALLLIIARSVSSTVRRRNVREATSFPLHSFDHDGAYVSDQEEALLLKEVVLSLPKIHLDVFVLSRLKGMTYEQIAAALGISVKTVEWRMSRALALCAAKLRE